MSMSKYTLYIKTDNEYLKSKYSEHGFFNVGDSGLDLFCPKDVSISCGETSFVELDIKCEMFEKVQDSDGNFHIRNVSYYLYPRSSISKTPLILKNSVGIIDAGYRGEIKGAFYNTPSWDDIISVDSSKTPSTYLIKKGTRLLQICAPNLEPFQFMLVNELTETSRGTGGYGSTGI